MHLRRYKKSDIRKGTRVLMRIEANVPMKNGRVEPFGDFRLRAVLPEIISLSTRGAKVVLVAHVGRPNGKRVAALSTKPIATYLSHALKRRVRHIEGTVGERVERNVALMRDGDVVMLENIRFEKGEERNDAQLGKSLAKLGDLYINSAFGVCHRKQASIHAVTRYISSFAGDLLAREVDELKKPRRSPSVLVIGGIKLETKVPVIQELAWSSDSILLGGGIGAALVAAERGVRVKAGTVTLAKSELDLAGQILERYAPLLHLPVDFLIDDRRVRSAEDLKPGDRLFDIGPRSVRHFSEVLKGAKTVLWNGPMGDIRETSAQRGTIELARTIARNRGVRSVVGGGDTVAFLEQKKLVDRFTFVSTGGGAMLEFLAGKKLPGLDVLMIK